MGFLGRYLKNAPEQGELRLSGFRSLVCDRGFQLLVRDGSAFSHLEENGRHVLVQGRALQGSRTLSPRDLLARYSREGEAALDGLDGTFAAVLWDADRGRLLLGRDDFGAKLLYYLVDAQQNLFFSDTISDLLLLVGKPGLSRAGLVEYLRFLDISPPYTMYQDLWFLEPEKVVVAGAGELTLREKKPRVAEALDDPGEYLEAERRFGELFLESVQGRLQGAGSAGAFLSGGIDSSLVCSVAAVVRPDLKAFTVGFPDPRFDESGIARAVAGHLGIAHEVLVFDPESDLKAFHEFTSTIPSPFADPAIIPTYQCFRKIAGEVDVVLDGTGADTLIGIMPARHLRFILDHSRHLPKPVRRAAAGALRLSRVAAGYADLFAFEDPAELLIRWKGWSRREIETLLGGAASLDHTMFFQIYRGNPDKSPYELYSMLMGALPDDRIHQSGSLFGQEVAFPFSDSEVQGYVRSLPLDYRCAPGVEKRLFRSLLGRYVPEPVWNVPKHGFDFPFAELLSRNRFALLDQYLNRDALARHGLFDDRVVLDVVTRFKEGDLSLRFKVWGLAVFQSWHENYYRSL